MGRYKRGLTARHDEYCRRRADGESYSAAYKGAGFSPDGTTTTARENAFAMENKSGLSTDILRRIQYYRDAAERGAILDRAQRQALLSELATSETVRPSDRVHAVDVLCKMSGDYTAGADIRVTVVSEAERRAAWNEALKGPGTAGNDAGGET